VLALVTNKKNRQNSKTMRRTKQGGKKVMGCFIE
jgi:hypothetical protein